MSKAPAVDYAIEILELFASSGKEFGISDVSNKTGINKNAVSRIFEALTEKSWLYCSDEAAKKYRITARPLSLFAKQYSATALHKIAAPVLEELRSDLGDTVYVGVKDADKVLYILHLDSTKMVRVCASIGGSYPLHASAPGKVLLAHSDASYIDGYYSRFAAKLTENTITDASAFHKEAKQIKDMGYALDNEEYSHGIVCIAVPIFDSESNVIATLGLSSLTIYDNCESLIQKKLPYLLQSAKKISDHLGRMNNKEEML